MPNQRVSGTPYSVAALLSMAVLAGCAASIVQRPGSVSPVARASANATTRPGVVRYLNDGTNAIRTQRRADAYKEMAAACNGPYRIDDEGPQVKDGVVVPLQNGTIMSSNTNDWFIQFSCMRADSSSS